MSYGDLIKPLNVDCEPKGITISNAPYTETPLGIFVELWVESRCEKLYKYCVENGLDEIDYNDEVVK